MKETKVLGHRVSRLRSSLFFVPIEESQPRSLDSIGRCRITLPTESLVTSFLSRAFSFYGCLSSRT
jgi:hypothetical protein